LKTQRKPALHVVAILAAFALVAAACGSSSKNSSSSGGTSGAVPTTSASQKHGGTIVIAAEQWPDCLNPITQCANSSWLQWLVPIHVLPRLAELDTKNNFVASPLVTELPSLSNGGLKESPFTVTWHLNPNAKWSDGTPITSADVAFTEQAYLKSKGSLSTAGYDQITSIDSTDTHTAVINFKKVYADWADLFGGFSGVVLEKSKFTSPDTSTTMQQSIDFSGGPWILKSFSKSQEILVPNTNYWDKSRIPLLTQVTFVPRTDTSTEVQSVKSGESVAAYPQPTTANVPQFQGSPNISTTFGVTTQYENLWMNQKAGHPFADKNVRAAFSYAFDRQKFLNDIVKPFDPSVQMLNCAVWVPGVGDWCDNTQFADITADPAKVAQYMQASGYAKDSSGIWAKGGKEITIKWMVNSGNQRREDTQAEFIPLLAKQGFKLSTDNSSADSVFQQRLPTGDYDLGMFIEVTSPDPTVTGIMACDSIPGPANQGAGQNQWWWCNQPATALMKQSDTQLDVSTRTTQIHQIGQYIRNDFVTLPLYAFPSMMVYRTDKIEGPINAYINNPESNLFNLYAWSIK
jgi:peptide/nickel transport system substrate-binding protein